MVDFKKLGDRAKDLIEKRGGTDALKEDAAESSPASGLRRGYPDLTSAPVAQLDRAAAF